MRAGGPSLNPKGRPKVGESLAAALRQAWPPTRVVALAERLVSSEDDRVALQALTLVIARAYGAAPVTVELTADVDGHAKLDVRAILAALPAEIIDAAVAQLDAVGVAAGQLVSGEPSAEG